MRVRRLIVVASLLLLAGACSGDDDGDDVDASGGDATTTTVDEETTTTTSSDESDETTTSASGTGAPVDCDAALDDVFAALDAFLDRAEADPSSLTDESDAIGEVMTELGASLGTACRDTPNEALSAVVVYISDQADTRGEVTAEVANGVLSGLCGSLITSGAVQLTEPAQAACDAAPPEA